MCEDNEWDEKKINIYIYIYHLCRLRLLQAWCMVHAGCLTTTPLLVWCMRDVSPQQHHGPWTTGPATIPKTGEDNSFIFHSVFNPLHSVLHSRCILLFTWQNIPGTR